VISLLTAFCVAGITDMHSPYLTESLTNFLTGLTLNRSFPDLYLPVPRITGANVFIVLYFIQSGGGFSRETRGTLNGFSPSQAQTWDNNSEMGEERLDSPRLTWSLSSEIGSSSN
jgi:hypothetical protein